MPTVSENPRGFSIPRKKSEELPRYKYARDYPTENPTEIGTPNRLQTESPE
jgi:hypothetical protein